MTDETIEVRLIRYISEELLLEDGYELSADDELLLDGLIDSIGATRVVGFVDDTWNLKTPAQDITVENFGSVNQIADYVRRAKRTEGRV